VALLDKQLDYSSPKLSEIIYNCQMCGACDVSCKYAMDMEVLEPIQAVRMACVENGHTLPVFDKMVGNLRKNGSLLPNGSARACSWFDDLKVKKTSEGKTEVLYHAGCRTSHNRALWINAQSTVKLLQKAGIDIGIAGDQELCCAGRAYQLGYKEDFLKQARANVQKLKKSGVKTLVTGCAECYHSFKVLYERFNLLGKIEVLHTSQYLETLVGEEKLVPGKPVDMTVTYHDPCYLGRLGEPYIHWSGKQIPGQIRLFDPPKEFRRGTYGVYAAPREVLKSIPGLKLAEMPRTREYAWCCGGGGGVQENNPSFADWTAAERVREAGSTGANAIVTACPGCQKLFTGVIKDQRVPLRVYDLVEILAKSAL
jgi:Fe-S oxidoreductase